MKRWMLILLTGLLPTLAMAASKSSLEISKDVQNPSFTKSIDVSGYDWFSAQLVYSTATPSASSVSDGGFSSTTLTVANYSALHGQGAYGTITLTDGKNNTSITTATVTLGSKVFKEGTHWNLLESSTATMASLAAAIDADWEYSATASSNVITITYGSVGTKANTYAMTASTGVLECSASTLSSGQPYSYLNINGTALTEGTDYTAATSSGATAASISDAINANATLSAIVTASTPSAGVIQVVSNTSGVNLYAVSVSSPAALTPWKYRFYGGSSSDISVSADTFNETAHGFSTGLPVLLSTVSNSVAPTGLVRETTYYAIAVTANKYQLSDTSTGAVAGLDIDITAVNGGGTFTITPITFAKGSCGWYWEGSNDGTNFKDLTSAAISSTTYSTDGSDLWNFTDYAYKYLRLYFTGPTYGGLNLAVTLNGKK
jgi:hypothetical protein